MKAMWRISTVSGSVILLAGCLCLAFCNGCSRSASRLDQEEENSPLMERALREKRFGNDDTALELFRKTLDKEPSLARAHLEIAFLLDKKTGDYVLAIYHYNRYLELRPTSDKRELIQERIRMAKLAFAATISGVSSNGAQHMIALEKENSALRMENDLIRGQVRDLQSRLHSIAIGPPASSNPPAGNMSVVRAPDVNESMPDGVAGSRIGENTQGISVTTTQVVVAGDSHKAPPSGNRKGTTYTVQRGDTLAKIALKFYQNSKRWNDIYNANRGIMRTDKDLRPGMTLKIPP